MVASTTQTRKAKGRRLQQWVRDLILDVFKLELDDVRSTSMGASGEDVLLSPLARKHFPYTIECKAVERLSVWEAYEQAKSFENDYEPLLIMKRNRTRPLAVVDAEYFIRNLRHEKDNTD